MAKRRLPQWKIPLTTQREPDLSLYFGKCIMGVGDTDFVASNEVRTMKKTHIKHVFVVTQVLSPRYLS